MPEWPRKLLDPTWQNLYYPPKRNEYPYFESANLFPYPVPTCTNDMMTVLRKAAWAADFAMFAYGRWGSEIMPPADRDDILRQAGFGEYTTIGDWSLGGHGTQALFAWNDAFAVIAFRGTERDDPTDLGVDGLANRR